MAKKKIETSSPTPEEPGSEDDDFVRAFVAAVQRKKNQTSSPMPKEPRPVRDDAVNALDAALEGLGGRVMHAIDPSRLVSYQDGGPPVWSVGMVDVPGNPPYTLLVTYGFSHVLSPESFREGIAHEYSLAVPEGFPLHPWADALLRHMCRHILYDRADIEVNHCVPFEGVPITRIPFEPQYHAELPNSTLVGVLAAPDPVLPVVATPAGDVEIRRLVGIDSLELDRAETWSFAGFLEEFTRVNPLLLSAPIRRSFMEDPAFRYAVNQRATTEGSNIDAALFDLRWAPAGRGAVVHLPKGGAAKRLLDALRGRVGFGRPLTALSPTSPAVDFQPGAPGMEVTEEALVLMGGLDAPLIARLVASLESGAASVRLGAR